MSDRPMREYCVMVIRVWGGFIAGPVIGALGLIFPVIAYWCDLGAKTTAEVSIGSLIVAALFLWPAQYQAWKQERRKLETEVAKNQLPEIRGRAENFRNENDRSGDSMATGELRRYRYFVCEVHAVNVRQVDTNITGVEIDGSGLVPPVEFSDLSAVAVVLQYAREGVIQITGKATVAGKHQGRIALDRLQIRLMDGLKNPHRIGVEPGQELSFQ